MSDLLKYLLSFIFGNGMTNFGNTKMAGWGRAIDGEHE